MLIVTLAWEIIPVNRWHHLISLQFPLVSNSFSTSAIFHTPSKVEFWQEGSILRFLIVYCLSACILFVFCLSFEYIKCTQPSLDNCITYVHILSETLPPLLTSPNAPVRFIWWCQPLFFSGRKRRLGLLGAKRTTITVHRYRQLSSSHEKWQFLPKQERGDNPGRFLPPGFDPPPLRPEWGRARACAARRLLGELAHQSD